MNKELQPVLNLRKLLFASIKLAATALLIIQLWGCAASIPGPGDTFRAHVFSVVTAESLQPHGSVVEAVRDGVTLMDAWQGRLVFVRCVTSPDREGHFYNELRLAVAPSDMKNLYFSDTVLITKGSKVGEKGPVSRILQRLPPPTKDQLVTLKFGPQEILCNEALETLNARVVSTIYPLQFAEAEMKLLNPLRGMAKADLDNGRMVILQCSRGEETNPLFWYARLPDGMTVQIGDTVEAVAGRPDLNWFGGPVTPFTRATPDTLRTWAEEYWPVQLSRITRVIVTSPLEKTHRGILKCR